MESKYIVAIEIGSSKIKGAIGSVDSNGEIKVLAVEEVKEIDIVRYGCILNVAEVAEVIRKIISRLEGYQCVSHHKIKAVYVSLGGRSLAAVPHEVQRQLSDELEITEQMISQIIDSGLNSAIADREIIHVIPRAFYIDKRLEMTPVGVFGKEILARLNLIVCRPQIRRNLNLVICERLKLILNDSILRPTAIADLVLTENEKGLGCMLVDFGAETTTVSIYKSGVLQYLVTIPMGSRNISRDITSINCLEERAEELKKAADCSTAPESTKKASVDGVDLNDINNYVQARANEIVSNIVAQIEYAKMRPADLPSGIIVVGGGAKLRGFNALLAAQSGMPVRSGAIIGHISIVDNNISASDSIDVISILVAAARGKNLEECLEEEIIEDEIEEVSENIEDSDDVETQDIDNEYEDGDNVQESKSHSGQPAKANSNKGGLWSGVMRKIAVLGSAMIVDPEDDDDTLEDQEDKD